MLGALKLIREKIPSAQANMVVPTEATAQLAKSLGADMAIQIGNLPAALAAADVAIAKTGTVTMECAFFRVPTVTLYKGSWLNYQIARHFIVTVPVLAMATSAAASAAGRLPIWIGISAPSDFTNCAVASVGTTMFACAAGIFSRINFNAPSIAGKCCFNSLRRLPGNKRICGEVAETSGF